MDQTLPATVVLPSGTARIAWRRSSRARRVSLRIHPADGSVIVTLPLRATYKAGMALLMDHADWVSDRLAALPEAIRFEPGACVPIGGVPHLIRHTPQARGGAWIEDGALHVSGAPDFVQRRVRDFLRQEARRRLTALTAVKAAAIGIAPLRVTIKDTSSRWGSCAPDRTIALSWRLVLAPDFVQDYVVAHEAAHLRHMNHGPHFWSLVQHLTPHRHAAMVWLKAEGTRLLRIG
ncbi:M48 family metallopeptidase [Rhodopila sp.]|jgi:predicted metal-dependent hydrolase|uniref:M48 family metallopeptidase n=1 Tax=Rhodopila sp. TaxID=2480087 RepID=UPI002B97B64E|nr:SprT family zinc-dependent metalloprotease [Rhodopila sp.]HVZ08510.1 SprT family zinc-dependent metalloprotease [Rhodopila sp.]